MKRIVALLLILAMLLCGCSSTGWQGILNQLGSLLGYPGTTHFSDMTYTRPDMDSFRRELEACLTGAETETKVSALMDKVYSLYQVYYDFYTAYSLANIHYCQNLTDIYWTDEYTFCSENAAEIDAGMDQLLYALADSSLREELESEKYFGPGYFDYYDGESIWDETFTDYANREAELINTYYDLSTQALEAEYYSEEFFTVYGTQMAELFVQMVALRQEMAAYAGYDSYEAFSYDFYYYRDYTPEQAAGYLEDICRELAPLYERLPSQVWTPLYDPCTEAETLAYVRETAQAMGGTAAKAFALMESAGLYDISYSENKYDASFETFLMSYLEPFIFVNPSLTAGDKLTFVHEFGHFCNDYASGGSYVDVDVAEIFSQSMEYLSLSYCEDGKALEKVKMADSLCVFVEQAAYASFEQQVYRLKGDDLTVENVQALYGDICAAYGMKALGRDSRDYVLINHFFTNPMYVISYVLSNDAALQIYQLEQAETGSGARLLQDNFDTIESYFLAFTESAGLKSPFTQGRAAEVRKTLETILFS